MEAAFLLQKIAEEMGIVFHHEEITVEENRQRNEYLRRYYNPETGEGSDTGDRRILRLPDAPIPVQYIPKALFDNEMMAQRLVECGSLAGYAERYGHDKRIATDEAGRNPKLAASGDATEELWREWIRVRIRYDFEFWAFSFVRIKDKLGAEDIPFRLNRRNGAYWECSKICARRENPFASSCSKPGNGEVPLSYKSIWHGFSWYTAATGTA